ncbi:MAG: hypothetical protein JXA49_10560 [Actinobacteria bacterium]|nr:hypothetical protein [Actinomycetota bacterium]
MICPICEAENPQGSSFCGLCLSDLGPYYSRGLVNPPEWYSPSDYKMIYSESAYIASRLKTQAYEKEKPAARKSNAAQLNRISANRDEAAKFSPWI